ncbi:MAG: ABC transporter permease [Cyclobacteriaceae bacterium]
MTNRPFFHPPEWSTRFFRWFCKDNFYEDIQGDLEEEYQLILDSRSLIKAKSWYNWQIVKLFRPSMMKKVKTQDSIEKETTMFKNYFKIGFRNLIKYKSSSLINVIGLSTGLASFILIALYVFDELSYDKHFQESELIHRVTVKNFNVDGDMSRQWAFASSGHAERLKEDYAEITHSTRFFAWAFPDLQVGDKVFPSEQVVFADNDVFEIFNFPFIQGNPETAFNDVYNLVLTEATAIRIFGNDWREQDIIGKTIKLSRNGQSGPFKVSGVMEDMPDQQHFHFEYLAPLRFLQAFFDEDALNNIGGNYNWLTYIKVAPGTNISSLTQRTNDEFWDKYMDEIRGNKASIFYDFEYQPIASIHLNSNLEGELETNGSIEQVTIFATIGILLLLVAIVNYMNLATSHYTRRMKEIGVRKVIGAQKSSLIKQFLTESTIISLISLPVAIMIVYMGLPYINEFMEKQLSFNFIENIEVLAGILALMLIVGFTSGAYPAVFLSRVNLIQALKGEQAVNATKWNFRSVLVTFQYCVTIGLIFTIMVIESQMQFIQNTNPGYEREQLLQVSMSRDIENLDVFKQELLSHPNINKAAYASRIPTGRLMDNWGSAFYKGDSLVPSNFRLPVITVDEDFISTFGIELVAGEPFNRQQNSFEDSVGYYIINRKAAEAFGYQDPNEIIGKRLSYGPFNDQQYRIGRIQAVTEDFNFESLHTEIKPMVMIKAKNNLRRIVLQVNPSDMESTLKFIEDTWIDFDPKNSINYRFVDELFDQQYQQEERLGTMIKVFTIIAIMIGCLGLVGMVGFIIETKLKEIGIRKVLGASSQNILFIVTNRFLILIGVAAIIAIPLAYWQMYDWLQNFVYHSNISIFVMLAPIFLAAIITLLATGYQTLKASMVNPVECLKDE